MRDTRSQRPFARRKKSYVIKPQMDARVLLMEPTGKFYWKRTWDIVNDYLVEAGEASMPITYDYFWGQEALRRLD